VGEVSGCNEAVSPIVAWAGKDEHPRHAGGRVLGCQWAGDRQAGKLHELIDAEAHDRSHEVFIELVSLVLTEVGDFIGILRRWCAPHGRGCGEPKGGSPADGRDLGSCDYPNSTETDQLACQHLLKRAQGVQMQFNSSSSVFTRDELFFVNFEKKFSRFF
jgi:hypothetical protein